MTYEIIHSDVLAALRAMPDNSFDAALLDPPYGLGSKEPSAQEIADYILGKSTLDTGGDFMGSKWSVPPVAVWKELLRVLKPGAPCMSFAGTRTQDLIGIGMRAAGFWCKQTLMWVYATGFAKSLQIDQAIDDFNEDEREVIGIKSAPQYKYARDNSPMPMSRAAGVIGGSGETHPAAQITAPGSEESEPWDGYGTDFSPSYEPIIVARKPNEGTYAENALKWGVAGLNIDAGRIGEEGGGTNCSHFPGPCLGHEGHGKFGKTIHVNRSRQGEASADKTYEGNGATDFAMSPGQRGGDPMGRWPKNIIFDETMATVLDAQSGERKGMSGGGIHRADYGGGMFGSIDSGHLARNDKGGASIFYYIVKPSRWERDYGCEDLPTRSAADTVEREEGSAGLKSPRAGAGRTSGAKNFHKCVKPIDLLRYLATLELPPPREVSPRKMLVLYSGSGSEMAASLRAGWDHVVGVEREAEYIEIAHARIKKWLTVPFEYDVSAAKAAAMKNNPNQGSLF